MLPRNGEVITIFSPYSEQEKQQKINDFYLLNILRYKEMKSSVWARSKNKVYIKFLELIKKQKTPEQMSQELNCSLEAVNQAVQNRIIKKK